VDLQGGLTRKSKMASPFTFAFQKAFECEHSTFTGLPRCARWTLIGMLNKEKPDAAHLFFFRLFYHSNLRFDSENPQKNPR
jgi:hypothetical protein